MNERHKIMLDAIRSPYGEISFTHDWALFEPMEGEQFSPVLIHVNLSGLYSGVYNVIKDLCEMPNPPLVLFTETDKTSGGVTFANYINEHELHDAFNAIISVNNDGRGYVNGYATMFNNLPPELEEFLDARFMWGKYTNTGSRLSEGLACVFNKPCITLHLIGAEGELQLLAELAASIPAFTDYNYSTSITNWELPGSSNDTVCCCCGKKRGKLKFFYRLQAHLCPVCEKKVKAEGDVTLLSLCKVGVTLQQERTATRRANYRKQLADVSTRLCVNCSSHLVPNSDFHWYCPRCDTQHYLRRDVMYVPRDIPVFGLRIYKYQVKDSGYEKLLSITNGYTDEFGICMKCGDKAFNLQSVGDVALCPTCFITTAGGNHVGVS